jgi:NADH-quinone oxidoreductase subunit J
VSLTLYVFYFLSFVGVLCALLVVLSKNPVHSVLYLILTFFCIFGHYVLLNAQFLAIVHLIVYAGAIMVLFLYVIMMLNLNHETEPHKGNLVKFAAAICAGLLLLVIIAGLRGVDALPVQPGQEQSAIGMVKSLGTVLFDDFLLPFEMTSVLLLTAMVGAVMLGKEDKNNAA